MQRSDPIKEEFTEERLMLSSIFKEYAILEALAAKDLLQDDQQYKAAFESLDTTTTKLADTLGTVYGQEFMNKFLDELRNYNNKLLDYAAALKRQDTIARDKAAVEQDNLVQNLARLLSGASEGLSQDLLEDLMIEHSRLERSFLDNQSAENFSQAFLDFHLAYEQIGKLAEAIFKDWHQ